LDAGGPVSFLFGSIFMANVVVVYHSGYGHTAKVAQAVARGAQSVPGAAVKLISVDDVKDDFGPFNAADAIIFGCPTYMGGPSAPFKAFIDAASKVWLQQKWKNKIAAGFTNSGSLSGDKLNTLVSLFINAIQHSMVWVGLGELPAPPEQPDGARGHQTNRLGSFSGAMSQANVNAGPEDAPPAGDLQTGEVLGRRVAEIAAQFVRGRS
jgi:NAD(P)H dehydrogenase (quinone)